MGSGGGQGETDHIRREGWIAACQADQEMNTVYSDCANNGLLICYFHQKLVILDVSWLACFYLLGGVIVWQVAGHTHSSLCLAQNLSIRACSSYRSRTTPSVDSSCPISVVPSFSVADRNIPSLVLRFVIRVR